MNLKMNFNRKITPFIDFTITDKCNYHCEYCSQETRVENEKNNLAINASDEIIDNFKDIVKTLNGKWQIRLMGGEALIHPRFFELAEFIVSNDHNLQLTTNFSFPIDTYKKLVNICGEKLESLCVSLHLSQIKSIEDFINKVIEFKDYKSKKTSLVVVSVLTEENFETLRGLKEKFDELNIKFSFQRFKIHGELVRYSKEIEEYLVQNPDHSARKIESLNDKNMFGNICNAGFKSFNIHTKGNINRCFTDQRYLNSLGNLKNKNFKLFNKPMPCLAKECKCCIVILNNNLIETDRKNYFKAYYFSFLYAIKKKLHIIKSLIFK